MKCKSKLYVGLIGKLLKNRCVCLSSILSPFYLKCRCTKQSSRTSDHENQSHIWGLAEFDLEAISASSMTPWWRASVPALQIYSSWEAFCCWSFAKYFEAHRILIYSALKSGWETLKAANITLSGNVYKAQILDTRSPSWGNLSWSQGDNCRIISNLGSGVLGVKILTRLYPLWWAEWWPPGRSTSTAFVNVVLLGKKRILVKYNLSILRSSWIVRVGLKFSAKSHSVLIEDGGGEAVSRRRQGLELCTDTEECLGPLGTGKGKEGVFPRAFRESLTLLPLRFWTSEVPGRESISIALENILVAVGVACVATRILLFC